MKSPIQFVVRYEGVDKHRLRLFGKRLWTPDGDEYALILRDCLGGYTVYYYNDDVQEREWITFKAAVASVRAAYERGEHTERDVDREWWEDHENTL